MAKIAVVPVTWHHFQYIMSQLGYEMASHTPEKDGVIFRLTGKGPTEGLKNPVTISYPDCVAADQETPAYEKNVVIDLISEVVGANGDKGILTIIFNRGWDA